MLCAEGADLFLRGVEYGSSVKILCAEGAELFLGGLLKNGEAFEKPRPKFLGHFRGPISTLLNSTGSVVGSVGRKNPEGGCARKLCPPQARNFPRFPSRKETPTVNLHHRQDSQRRPEAGSRWRII